MHLGGVSTERPFEPILQANIKGVFNLYEAARRMACKRIVFASSNHVIGFYRQDEVIDAQVPLRPDGYYGLSKSFGENMARFYFDRYGIETVCLRIGSSLRRAARPPHAGHLAELSTTCERLVDVLPERAGGGLHRGLRHVGQHARCGGTTRAPRTSATRRRTAPKRSGRHRGDASRRCDPKDPAAIYQGGAFVRTGPSSD